MSEPLHVIVAFTVLDTLFPAQHASLQTQYDASLALVTDGARKDAGIDVGQAAAAAMLAGGHDARTGPAPALPPASMPSCARLRRPRTSNTRRNRVGTVPATTNRST